MVFIRTRKLIVKHKRGDIKVESNDSPEIPDEGRHQTSPASLRRVSSNRSVERLVDSEQNLQNKSRCTFIDDEGCHLLSDEANYIPGLPSGDMATELSNDWWIQNKADWWIQNKRTGGFRIKRTGGFRMKRTGGFRISGLVDSE